MYLLRAIDMVALDPGAGTVNKLPDLVANLTSKCSNSPNPGHDRGNEALARRVLFHGRTRSCGSDRWVR